MRKLVTLFVFLAITACTTPTGYASSCPHGGGDEGWPAPDGNCI